MRKTHLAVGFAALFCLSAAVAAQTYPVKPIRYIVPFAPGGSTDVIARLIAQKLSESLGQQVVVDNRPGAGGAIGAELVARAPADGYTLLAAATGILAINQFLYSKLPYDAEKDFAQVTLVGALPLILVVHPSLPAKSVKELIAIAKARPHQLNYGSSGVGTATHMTTELFRFMTGIDIVHIPYKGSGQLMGDMVGGQLALIFDQVISSMPHVQAGKMRALGITSEKRFPTLPDLPAISETVKGYESVSWTGISVAANTPRPIINRLQSETAKALRGADLHDRLLRDGTQPIGSTPEEFEQHVKRERVKWGKVVRDSGARLD